MKTLARHAAIVGTGVAGATHLAPALFNAHSVVIFFDSLASARIIAEPFGIANVASFVLVIGCVLHIGRTCAEVRERRRMKRAQALGAEVAAEANKRKAAQND